MDGRIVRRGITSSCKLAVTYEILKALLATSSSHVRSAIASTRPYFFTLLSFHFGCCVSCVCCVHLYLACVELDGNTALV